MTVLARRLPLPPLSAVGCCQIRWRRLALPCPSCTETFFVLSRQPLHCLLLCFIVLFFRTWPRWRPRSKPARRKRLTPYRRRLALSHVTRSRFAFLVRLRARAPHEHIYEYCCRYETHVVVVRGANSELCLLWAGSRDPRPLRNMNRRPRGQEFLSG